MNLANTDASTTILVVEDSPEDYETTERAFRRAGMKNPIVHCEDGDEALDYLYRKGKYEDPESSPRPAIILLDLNLPGTDGREVLKQVKGDPDLQRIPIVVLTTSNDEQDIQACYGFGANSYICKPVNMDRFIQSITMLSEYWFEITILPRREEK